MTTSRLRLVEGSRALPLLALILMPPTPGHAQDTNGSTAAAVGGAALGLYSGAVFGTLGSLMPCTQTYAGAKCMRIAVATASAIGMASGIALGAADSERLADHAVGAGIGALFGLGAGLALKPFVPRYAWQDVAALALAGGGVGASAKGAVIGLGAGTVIGVALWQLIPSFELPNAFAAALAGLAIGGLTALAFEGVDAHSSDPGIPALFAPVTIRF